MVNTHCSHEVFGLLGGGIVVVADADGLFIHIQSALAPLALGGHAHGALTGVADSRLDAAGGHHHGAGGQGDVRALDQAANDVVAARDLAGSTEGDLVAQAGAHQSVVYGHEAIGEAHAHAVLELHGRRAGAAFCTIDDDVVRSGADGKNGLADSQNVYVVAHAQLETDRLSAGELAELRDELDELGGGWRIPCGMRG